MHRSYRSVRAGRLAVARHVRRRARWLRCVQAKIRCLLCEPPCQKPSIVSMPQRGVKYTRVSPSTENSGGPASTVDPRLARGCPSHDKTWPEYDAGCCSRMFFCWLQPLVRLANATVLEYSDLWRCVHLLAETPLAPPTGQSNHCLSPGYPELVHNCT
jgi:hypothetical protein